MHTLNSVVVFRCNSLRIRRKMMAMAEPKTEVLSSFNGIELCNDFAFVELL